MRAVLLILTVTFLSCNNNASDKLRLKSNVWVNHDLKFDTTYADGDSSLYSIYGSGTLLLLDTNHTVKTFTNTFINHNDSIAWGEPGVILTQGNWKEEGTNIIATHSLIDKTFILPSDTIGQVNVDKYVLKGDTLIRNTGERFIPAGLLTNELRGFLGSNWNSL